MKRWRQCAWILRATALALISPAVLAAQEKGLNINVRLVYIDQPSASPSAKAGHVSTLACKFDIEGRGYSGPGWTYEKGGDGLIHIESPWKLALTVDDQVIHLGDGPQSIDVWFPYYSTQPDFWTTSLTNHIDYGVEVDWLPTQPGSHELRCSLDAGHVVQEWNETDNVETIHFPVIGTLALSPDPTARAAAPTHLPVAPESKESSGPVRSSGSAGDITAPAKLPVGEAKLVTTSASTQPPQPMTGQPIAVHAAVQNQGALPSQAGLGFLVVCDETPGGPTCPKKGPFAATMPGIGPGSTVPIVVALDAPWPAGKYRLSAGTDVIFLNDAVEVELVVTSSPYSGVPMERGKAQRQDELSEASRELNPQPEPPSAEAAPAMPPAPARTDPSRPPPSQVFALPLWDGKRVDLCLVWGGQCGEPAATEFCKRSGYSKATAWHQADNIGAQTPTVVLSSGQVCSDASCDGFAAITCTR